MIFPHQFIIHQFISPIWNFPSSYILLLLTLANLRIIMSDANSQAEQLDDPSQPNTCKDKSIRALDLFSFLPVPRTKLVSTQRSILGTLIMLGLFMAYIIFTFIGQNNLSLCLRLYHQ
jgi:hypothetical protein